MTRVFIHGLGQRASSWEDTLAAFGGADCVCPELTQSGAGNYSQLYGYFSELMSRYDKVSLCGLSLGAVLALNYAADFPDRVNSLVLIGGQYKMPKALLTIQNMAFRFMPESRFSGTGFGKKEFIGLCGSMKKLDFSESLGRITCPALVMVGENDKANRKAAEELSEKLPKAALEIVPDAGHTVNTDAPQALAELLHKFRF